MKTLTTLLLTFTNTTILNSCTSIHQSMREPNSRVDFTSKDFTFSEQLSAEAKTIKVFGIDWSRLLNKSEGEVDQNIPANLSVASIPVVGNLIAQEKTINYALYNLMQANPGYDVVFYPQYEKIEKRPIGIPIVRITTVKVKARLAKIKTN